jgi:hypothetical protein
LKADEVSNHNETAKRLMFPWNGQELWAALIAHSVSTVALLAGQPKQMISYDLRQDPVAELLKSRQDATAFSFVQGDSLSVDIEPCSTTLRSSANAAKTEARGCSWL